MHALVARNRVLLDHVHEGETRRQSDTGVREFHGSLGITRSMWSFGSQFRPRRSVVGAALYSVEYIEVVGGSGE